MEITIYRARKYLSDFWETGHRLAFLFITTKIFKAHEWNYYLYPYQMTNSIIKSRMLPLKNVLFFFRITSQLPYISTQIQSLETLGLRGFLFVVCLLGLLSCGCKKTIWLLVSGVVFLPVHLHGNWMEEFSLLPLYHAWFCEDKIF